MGRDSLADSSSSVAAAASVAWRLPLLTSARESAALDAHAIAAGVPSRALMQRAGAAAASELARLHGHRLSRPVIVYTGPGNNGGDGWVVARALAASGVAVHVVQVGEARSEDARAERALALAEPLVQPLTLDDGAAATEAGGSALVVDALLGTGTTGAPRGTMTVAIGQIRRARERGATIVSLDIPSGVDADTGEATLAVHAHLTLTFGTIKLGLLSARGAAGRIELLDIGLQGAQRTDAANSIALVTSALVRAIVPPISVDAHKGTRRKLVIVGGQLGMAGAPVLAARAAMRSGIGMVRLVVARENVPVVQASEPHALAHPWPGERADELEQSIGSWADVVLIGPGLGDSSQSRALVERVLRAWRGPVVVDADALNVFKGEAAALGALLGGRPALLTPHVMEFSRLFGANAQEILVRRFDIGAELARTARCAVLLKGVPTVVTAEDGTRLVSAAGTPALAAAGSGDLLAGIAATLMGQSGDALLAGAAAAWVHGRAAELAEMGGGRENEKGENMRRVGARGVTLGDIERAIARVWTEESTLPRYPVLADLPGVGVPE